MTLGLLTTVRTRFQERIRECLNPILRLGQQSGLRTGRNITDGNTHSGQPCGNKRTGAGDTDYVDTDFNKTLAQLPASH